MTKEDWRNLQPGNLVTILNSFHIFKVIDTGWGDMEEKDFQDDNDYIIEVKDLFDCYKESTFIVRAHQTNVFNLNVPTEIIDIAKNHESPYDFLDGYFISTEKLKNYETLDSKR